MVVARHLKGDQNYTKELHELLALEIVHRRLLESPANGGSEEKLSEPKALTSVHCGSLGTFV